jgi:hypothetical protein
MTCIATLANVTPRTAAPDRSILKHSLMSAAASAIVCGSTLLAFITL